MRKFLICWPHSVQFYGSLFHRSLFLRSRFRRSGFFSVFLFCGSILPDWSFFSIRKFLHDFYNVKYTRILNKAAVSSLPTPLFFPFFLAAVYTFLFPPSLFSCPLLAPAGGSFLFLFLFFFAFLSQITHINTHKHTKQKQKSSFKRGI